MPIDFQITRRTALIGAGLAAAACSQSQTFPPRPAQTGVFRHGVASGDPLPDRVVIWTRPTTDAPSLDVRWEIARDPNFSRVLASGTVEARAENDHCVKVDVEGLEPGRDYIYRFIADGETSPVGRARTLVEGDLARMVIAFISCSNYPAGFFNAYRALAGRADVDLVLHLGDYIYEYGMGAYATERAEEFGRVVDPPHEILTLEDYRRRYAQYRADPDLQAAHAAAPWITTWDDHETANDSFATGAQNHQPDTEGPWSERRAAALQAYYEWLPIRDPAPGRDQAQAWRTFELGNLATLFMTETRLAARSPSITDADFPVPLDSDPDDAEVRERVRRFLTEEVGDPDREMLGALQRQELEAAFAASTAAGKSWQVLGNQVPFAPIFAPVYTRVLPRYVLWYARMRGGMVWDYVRRTAFNIPLTFDSWDGFPAERERVYQIAENAGANLIVTTGDTHTFYAADLADASGARRGVEFGTSSISSPSEFDGAPPGVNYGALTVEANEGVLAFHEPQTRGYTLLELTPDEAVATMIGMETVHQPDDTRSHAVARFSTRRAAGGGTTGLERQTV